MFVHDMLLDERRRFEKLRARIASEFSFLFLVKNPVGDTATEGVSEHAFNRLDQQRTPHIASHRSRAHRCHPYLSVEQPCYLAIQAISHLHNMLCQITPEKSVMTTCRSASNL